MKKSKRVPIIITVINIIVGFMLAIQYQSMKTTYAAGRQDLSQLRQNLQTEMERRDGLLNDIKNNEDLLNKYNSSGAEVRSQLVEEQLLQAKQVGGLTDITSKGITITIDDSSSVKNLENPVIDQDLLDLVSLLFANGAQAISINDNRIISTTSIRSIGENQIQVDTHPIVMPFTIKVIGDPQNLETALKIPGADGESTEDWFKFLNKTFAVTKTDKLTVLAYNGSNRIKYMKPSVQKGA